MYYLLFFIAVIFLLTFVASRDNSLQQKKVPVRHRPDAERDGPR